jgi:flavin-dependent dehydrogenase
LIIHPPTTWQVWREEFDQMILDKARDNGASVLEQTKASRLIKQGDKVTGIKASSQEFGDLELTAPVVIDASGRDCFACSQRKLDGSRSGT